MLSKPISEKPLLEVQNLDVFNGETQALWDVSFSIKKGDIVALVGANGAGKSTMLNTISGLIKPAKGEIRFKEASILNLKPEVIVTGGISHVSEGRRLFSRLTVLENLELGAFSESARPYMKESMKNAFELFPVLGERTEQLAGYLSGGEQQMLAIARSLMGRPTLLMLDEPSLGLAPSIVKLMFEVIQTLNENGVTILLVEQNVHQTLDISDYVYVLQTGRKQLEGLGEDLLRDPDFQKAYLGMAG